jgi:hypothetical protein
MIRSRILDPALRGIVLLLTLCISASPCLAAPLGPADFQLRAPLLMTPGAGAPLARAVLTRDILEASASQLADARLFGPDGVEIAYALLDNAPATGKDVRGMELRVLSYDRSQSEAVMVLEAPEGAPALAEIELKSPSRDFRKAALLESSPDAKTWSPLAQDAVYDFSTQIDLRKTRVAFPSTSARYLRLTLQDEPSATAAPTTNADAPGVKMRVGEVDLFLRSPVVGALRLDAVFGLPRVETAAPAVHDEAVFAKPTQTPAAPNSKDTAIELATTLPADALVLEIADTIFQREAEVYAILAAAPGTAPGAPPRQLRIGGANLHRFALAGAEQRNARVPLSPLPANTVALRVVIRNKDNPPLTVTQITLRWPQKLFFCASNAPAPAALYLKPVNPAPGAVSRPRYDAQRIAETEQWRSLPFVSASFGPLHPNAFPASGPTLADMERWLLPAGVVLLSIGLAVWLWLLLKKGKRGQEDLELRMPGDGPDAKDGKGDAQK